MDIQRFNQLSEKGKSFFIKNNGTYIATRRESGCWINLYELSGFFAEVWFQLIDNKIVFISTFESLTNVDPYLEKIDIQDVFN
ncbi:hypothetical protein QQ008_10330 [Fulvivirgaceae bacterium BMA10]|uniref:Uncharacterized protein n=1 Tax=Splendidivirga corallicola TaxID=3051826 RepID=A0ABT8KMU0_9BACT|nr:hypothetical protein [Fulvivirgaceae bacterium BMA10]